MPEGAAIAGVEPRPPAAALWWRALRAYAFPASIVPCLVGAAFAAWTRAPVVWWQLPLVLLAGMLLHVGTNLVNDAADYRTGVDAPGAQGGSGVLVAGWVTVRQVYAAAFIAFGLAAVVGLPVLLARGWPLVAIGAAGAVGGYAYTGPPFGLKYKALGEIWVFLLMGTLMVAGTAYALCGAFPRAVWEASIPVGFLVAAILATNNQRDLPEDGKQPIRTLAILFGPAGAKAVSFGLIAGGYLAVPVLWLLGRVPVWSLLALATVPLAVPPVRGILATRPDRPMPPGTVERVAALDMFFGAAYAAGFAVAALVG
jgi:1,4-dihydroxy-2-naphthoate octaprenyltransferase